jgi:tripartite-type tricarboxylate transporter receptor subunit TctC
MSIKGIRTMLNQNLGLVRVLAVLASLASSLPALAQPYPSKPIRIIMPFTAGIGTDVFARKLSPLLAESMGQPLVPENRTGASGAIGTEAVYKAAPDGYTILFNSASPTVALPHTMKELPYDPNGLTPIMGAIEPLIVIVIKPSLPANSLRELIEHARRNPGKLSYGSSGVGSTFHMFGASLNKVAGIDILHVPYKGTNLGVNDIMAGLLDIGFGSLAGIGPLMKAGKVRAVAILGEKRAPVMPDLPAVTDVVPGVDLSPGWFAFWGPPNLPQPIVSRFHAELIKAMNTAEMKAWYDTNGFAYLGTSPDELRAMQRKGIESYGRILKSLNIKPE